jgi:hypothetical protein
MQKLFFLLISLMVVSCTTGERPGKPSATGKAGELLVITPESRWEGAAGEHIKDAFKSEVTMLPQPEPQFNLIHIDQKSFVKLFETHRNIFFAVFDPTLERGKIEANRNVWAYPQRVIRVTVPDEDALKRVLENNRQTFIDMYLETERERLINAYRRMMNHQARKVVREELNLDITVPEGYFVAKNEDNFIWLRQTGTREDLDQGLMITVLPYTDPAKDFDHQTIWNRRDSITQAHIPGTFPDTYMTTYPDIPPIFREISFNDLYAVEARGLWRVEGDFMGGPFVNITFVDEQNNRLINLDGFVYAPKFEKRDYMRQVEPRMHSVKVIDPDEEETGQQQS